MKNHLYLLSAVLCLGLSQASAATYYVATNGLDSNSGTIGSPFKTLARGTLGLAAGDTLYIRGGVYREILQPATSGTINSPIVITAFPNEVVTINGADIVSGWSPYSNGIYKASVAWDLGEGRNQVFVDGEMMQQARFPNFGSGDLLHPVLSSMSIGSPNNIVSSPDWAGKPDNYWVGARFMGGIGSSYAYQTALVSASSGTNITLDPSTLSSQWFTGPGVGYLYGLMSLLDADKEWHLDTNADILYLQIPGGGDPNPHLVEVKHRVFTVNLTNVSYIKVQGLQLRAGAVQMTRGRGLTMVDCNGRFLSHFLKFPRGDVADFQNTWDHGVLLTATNSIVTHCTIYDTCSSSFYLDGTSNTITRNVMYNLDYTGVNGAGANIRGLGHTITFNTISNIGWACFSPQNDNTTGHKIMYNDVSKIAEVTKDTGVFYGASGSNPQRMRVAYNWFHDVFPWRFSGVFLYMDGASVNDDMDHNVCWNQIGRESVTIAGPSKSDNIFNNTIFNVRPPLINSTQVSLSNNLYLAWAPETQLTDWRRHDFRLRPGAPAIDAGAVILGITDGYHGSAPDLGAYETGGPYWVPGVDGWSLDQPGVRSDRPISWNGTSATLQGTLISAGTAPTVVYLCRGLADGGTNLASWPSVVGLGVYSTNPVVLTPQTTGLNPGTEYAYRFYATNANGVYWSAPQFFNASGGLWAADTDGLWSDISRWQNGIVPDGVDSFADFSTLDISADRTVTLDSPRTVGALRFNDLNGGQNWNLSGGGILTLSTTNVARLPSVEVGQTSAFIGVPLAGTEGMEKLGLGTLALTDQSDYTGTTLVSEGTLLVNGTLTATPVTVAEDATLAGAGRVDGTTTVNPGGAMSPGTNGLASAGTLIVSNLNLNAATLLFDFAGVTNPGNGINDLIYLQPGSVLTLQPTDGSTLRPVIIAPNLLNGYLTNGTYVIISNATAIVGDVAICLSAPGLPVSFSTNTGVGPYNIYMTVSNAVGRDLIWTGNSGTAWDNGVSSNWVDNISTVPAVFKTRDRVTFDDSAPSTTVNFLGNLSPASVAINNTSPGNDTFQGSGKVTGSASFTKSGTGSLTLKTVNDYTGPTIVENGSLIIGSANALPIATALALGQSNSNRQSTANLDLSSASQTVGTLKIASLYLAELINSSPAFIDTSRITNHVNIGAGQDLTVNGNVTIGDSVLPIALACNVAFTGNGTFQVQTNGGIFQFNGNDSTSSSGGTHVQLDMSRLAGANINLGSSGVFYVGDRSSAGDGASDSDLILASNTTVTAGSFNVGNSQRTALHTVEFGGGSNIFNVSTLQIGLTRDSGQMSFNTPGGSFKMRAADGASRANLIVGPSAGTTYAASNQFLKLGSHPADLFLNTLKVGEDSRGNTGAPYSSNYFSFSSGTLDTTTLRIGNRPGNPASTPALWFNVCDIGGGSVTIGSSGVVMGTSVGSNGSSSTNAATLNISGGTISVAGDFILGTQNSTAGNNTLVSSLNLSGGTLAVNGNILCGAGAANPAPRYTRLNLTGPAAVLDLKGHAIGGANNTISNTANFIDTLNFQAGTLQNIGQLNGGADLVKTCVGALILAGNNTYTGDTVVSNGVLNVLGTVGSANALRIIAGASLTGNGLIAGPAIINGTLSPGLSGVGALRINNTLTLAASSLTQMQLNAGLHAYNSVSNLTQVNYGGTLFVGTSGGTFAAGDTFVLFSANTYNGSFGSISLPTPGADLTWSNRLSIDGSLVVVGPKPSPQIGGVRMAGTNLVFTGIGGLHNGPYQIVTSTNLGLPLNQWIPMASGNFDADGNFSNGVSIIPGVPVDFIIIKQ